MTTRECRPEGYGLRSPGHRLPDATRLGPVRLQVSDLARSVEFYSRVLGLTLLDRDDKSARLAAAGAHAPIIELHERSAALPVPRQGRLGLYHFAILLPDRASLARFITHLATLEVRVGAGDHLVSEAIYLNDPDGLGIEVYADRPREAWRTKGGELMMDTTPLEMGGLLRAAGDQPWTGMPAGTVLGHVHLHVGDLEAAEAFYHCALGFDKVVWSYPGALFLSAGGYHHHLGTNTWAARAPSAADNEARLLEWTIVLPSQVDVERAYDGVTSAGYAAARDGDDVLLTDPWGTGLRLTAEA